MHLNHQFFRAPWSTLEERAEWASGVSHAVRAFGREANKSFVPEGDESGVGYADHERSDVPPPLMPFYSFHIFWTENELETLQRPIHAGFRISTMHQIWPKKSVWRIHSVENTPRKARKYVV